MTLAKTLQQDNICLSMGGVGNPLATCLVGIPLPSSAYLPTGKRPSLLDTWDVWAKTLSHAPEEPQELDLLGSSKAPYCIYFHYKGAEKKGYYSVNPTKKINSSVNWCNYTTKTMSASTDEPRVL